MGHKFSPLKKEPTYVKVYNAVEADILSGRLSEGAALPTEIALCDQFGVTRATVREGLRLLEQADLVERGAAKRFYVKRPNTDDVAAATSKGLSLGGVTFREVWETLSLMYPQTAREAARGFDKDALARLLETNALLASASDRDSEQVVDLAVEFFQALVHGLDNRVMLALLQSLNIMIGASLKRVIAKTPKARQRIVKAQKQIIDAIDAKDGEAAALWMSKHIDDLKRGYAVAKVELDQSVL